MSTQAPLGPVPEPVSRSELTTDALRTAILRGDLAPGAPLVERDLAQLLGVSKTPIREALQALHRRGLVTFSPFKGAYVRQVDVEFARSIYDVRYLLEPEAVRRSIPRDEDWLAEARGVLQTARKAAKLGNFADLSAQNRHFHRLLYAYCGNPVLTAFLDDIQDQVALIATHAWRKRRTWDREAGDHQAILEAVESQRGDRAAELLRAHISGALGGIVEALCEEDDG